MTDITINISIPVEEAALINAANSLLQLAKVCNNLDSSSTTLTTTPKPMSTPVAADGQNTTSEPVATLPRAGGVELDSAGLPWDPRIHSSKKTKLAKDGTWKKGRGVDKDLVIQVEAELRAAMSAPTPTPALAPAPTPALAPAPTPMLYYSVGGENYTADQLRDGGWSEDQINGLPTVEVSQNDLDFPTIMSKITQAVAAGTLTNEQVNTACNAHGLASLPLLASRPDLISVIDKALF